MTPFDPIVLLVMLRTFYPAATPAALARARRERPEYFSGGAIVGPTADALELPDGRLFSLLWDGTPFTGASGWRVEPAANGTVPSPWPFDAGPLRPIDAEFELPPPVEPRFTELVASHFRELAGAPELVAVHAGELVAGGDGHEVDGVFEGTIGRAAGALGGHISTFEGLDAAAVRASAEGLGEQVGDAQRDYPDPDTVAPPDIDVDPAERAGPFKNDAGGGALWIEQ